MKVIINADDFGIDIDRDIGITYGVIRGYITSVSVITTNKIGIIRKFLINIIKRKASVGIHINLTDNPLTEFNMEDLVLNSYNYKKSKYSFWRNSMENTIIINKIKNEIYGQLKRFIKSYKFFPSHIDGHNHCNIFNKKIEKIFEEISSKYKIHLRIPYENSENFDNKLIKNNKFFDDYYKFKNQKVTYNFILENLEYYLKYDMYLNNYMSNKNCKKDVISFIGTMYGYFREPNILYNQLLKFSDKDIIQIMVHPGFYWKILKHKTPFSNKDRLVELKSLKKLKKMIKRDKIQYVNYSIYNVLEKNTWK